MKRIITFVAALSIVIPTIAQSHESLMSADSLYYFELYRPYPVERIDNGTPAPKGYKPFYISHLGRHGCRWCTSRHHYTGPLAIFAAAHDAGELTPLGERFYADWQRVAADADNRNGDLSPRGAQEHIGIACRMYNSYPEVFATKHGKPAHVDCRSTTVPRCILSMASFVQALSRLAPEADITMESSNANAWYLASYADLNSVKTDATAKSDSVRRAYMPSPERFIGSLFCDGSRVVAEKVGDKSDFMYNMYLHNAILKATDHVGISTLEYLFTEDELAALWRCSNMRRYVLTGPSAWFSQSILNGARPLLKNVIETADRAIATGDEQATLRFAHDVTVIPFVNLMGIRCGSVITDNPSEITANWQCNVVTPMASNVQLVFFRNKAGDILVKVLHCECEQRLDSRVGEPIDGVYYRWSDLRRYMVERLEE